MVAISHHPEVVANCYHFQPPKESPVILTGGLEASGGFWKLLEASGSFWRLLEASGCSWRLLEASGGSWKPLEASEGFRRLLEVSGCFWRLLEASGGFWKLNAFLATQVFREQVQGARSSSATLLENAKMSILVVFLTQNQLL